MGNILWLLGILTAVTAQTFNLLSCASTSPSTECVVRFTYAGFPDGSHYALPDIIYNDMVYAPTNPSKLLETFLYHPIVMATGTSLGRAEVYQTMQEGRCDKLGAFAYKVPIIMQPDSSGFYSAGTYSGNLTALGATYCVGYTGSKLYNGPWVNTPRFGTEFAGLLPACTIGYHIGMCPINRFQGMYGLDYKNNQGMLQQNRIAFQQLNPCVIFDGQVVCKMNTTVGFNFVSTDTLVERVSFKYWFVNATGIYISTKLDTHPRSLFDNLAPAMFLDRGELDTYNAQQYGIRFEQGQNVNSPYYQVLWATDDVLPTISRSVVYVADKLADFALTSKLGQFDHYCRELDYHCKGGNITTVASQYYTEDTMVKVDLVQSNNGDLSYFSKSVSAKYTVDLNYSYRLKPVDVVLVAVGFFNGPTTVLTYNNSGNAGLGSLVFVYVEGFNVTRTYPLERGDLLQLEVNAVSLVVICDAYKCLSPVLPASLGFPGGSVTADNSGVTITGSSASTAPIATLTVPITPVVASAHFITVNFYYIFLFTLMGEVFVY